MMTVSEYHTSVALLKEEKGLQGTRSLDAEAMNCWSEGLLGPYAPLKLPCSAGSRAAVQCAASTRQ